MTDLREAREAAYWLHWRQSLRENPRDGLPAFLDALEAIDAEHAAPMLVAVDEATPLTDEEVADLRGKLAEAVKEPNRQPEPLPLAGQAARVKPPARRRAPRGGTT